jgi:membrane protein DedA with SNARE-associated domain
VITQVITDFALHVLSAGGYLGLFFLSLIESAGIPIPSEVVLPFAGFLAATGRFTILNATIVATLGNYVGSVVLFWIGISGGRWILDRYGKYVFIHTEDIEKGDRWFSQHGAKAVFWGRLLPIVRTFISLPAGVNKMKFGKFSRFTILGGLPWNFGLAFIGYKAGEHWDALRPYFHYADIGIISIVIIFAIWFFIKHFKRRG